MQGPDLGTSLAAAGCAAAMAATAALQGPLQAAAAAAQLPPPWRLSELPQLAYASSGVPAGAFGLALAANAASLAAPSAAAAAPAAAADAAGSASRELASWLAAAQGAVSECSSSSRQNSQRSLAEGSRYNSSSGCSLWSMQSERVGIGQASSEASSSSSSACGSPAGVFGRSRSDSGVFSPATSVTGLAWGPETVEPIVSAARSTGAQEEQDEKEQQQRDLPDSLLTSASCAVLAAVQQQDDQDIRAPLRSHVMQQVKRLQQQLGGSKATRLAWISGALAASLRCAAALAAPAGAAAAAVGGPHLSLLALLPRALVGPAALAALHFVGHAAYKAAMPPSHPLGQQWVMTGAGLELVVKPLGAYPQNADALGLKELGGLFPGHRMIAYRRRLASLVSQAPLARQ